MIPLIQRVTVDEKKWLDNDEMLDCITVSQSMPGVIAVNAATYIGKRTGGTAGAVAATLGVVLPSFVIIAAVVGILGNIEDNKYVEGAFRGIKAAICGLIAVACIRLGKQSFTDWFGWALGIGAFVLVVFVKLTAVWVVIGGAVLGIIYTMAERHGDRS